MSIVIAMNNTGAKLMGADPEAVAIVSDLLSYDVEDPRFSAGGGMGSWNGKQTFLRFPDLLFEAGFVTMVRRGLTEAGYAVSILDRRDPVDAADLGVELEGIELRDYQKEAVLILARERRGVLACATGSGKTEIAIAATKHLGVPTLFLTHKLDLVRQTRERYRKRLGRAVGMISEGEWLPSEITVATVQTIMAHWKVYWKAHGKDVEGNDIVRNVFGDTQEVATRNAMGQRWAPSAEYLAQRLGRDLEEVRTILKAGERADAGKLARKLHRNKADIEVVQNAAKMPVFQNRFKEISKMICERDERQKVRDFLASAQFLITDEAHRSSGNSFFRIINACVNAYYRASLTATPLMKGNREDDLRLIACSGDVIYRITNNDLIEKGVLARPYFTFVEVPPFVLGNGRLPGPRTKYTDAYRYGIVENEIRHQIVVDQARRLVDKGRQTVVLVKEIKHGKRLAELIGSSGMACEWISGSASADTREAALGRLRSRSINVLIASTILDEGLDCDAISGIILAGGGKSQISLFQRVGRAVRARKGEDLERLGNTAEIVDLIDTGSHHLLKHSAKRFQAVHAEEGWEIEKILRWGEYEKILAGSIAA